MRIKGIGAILFACALYWILDSIWSYLSFEYNLKTMIFSEPASYLDTFLLKVSPYQVVSRLMVIALFIIFGALILVFMVKRQKAEKARQESHDTLLNVLNSIDATIYVADMESHEILFINQYMVDSFGGDFKERICYEFFCNSDSVCEHCPNDRLLDADGKPSGVVTWEGRNPVTNHWYLNNDRAIKWHDGRQVHLQIATDITQLKELQEKQHKAEEQLRHAHKMEAVGTLAGGIAHDFNNILQAIIGYTDFLMIDKSSLHPDFDNLITIRNAGERAAELVRQLLLFSRKAETRWKSVDMNVVLEQSFYILERTISKMIAIELHPGRDIRKVSADPVQLEQIILNLCNNAVDAMPGGGKIVIKTENVVIDHRDEMNDPDVMPGVYVRLSVSDTGQGMDMELIEHIFEPFFSTKEVGKGTGLGLASTYGIVKTHGGHIACDSEVGKGTTFKMLIPATEDDHVTESADTGPKILKEGQETILCVDDEKPIRDYLKKALENHGYKIITAATGEEAIEIYTRHLNIIDLVTLDIGMPGMGGRKCLREIMQINPCARVMIASGYGEQDLSARMIAAGASGFITKPYEMAGLLNSIRAVLDKELC